MWHLQGRLKEFQPSQLTRLGWLNPLDMDQTMDTEDIDIQVQEEGDIDIDIHTIQVMADVTMSAITTAVDGTVITRSNRQAATE
ncbi:MAG TPA: hypothetical protein VEF35_02075 [Candidatus Bathyarchaeia archaeon]|nr:hypothetical protein [Candidatus Bathyarchaeia archaeon]